MSSTEISCKVAECRFSSTHVTKGHKCGVCRNYGHGEIECIQPWRKRLLQEYDNDRMPNHRSCTVQDCRYRFFHSTAAHHCTHCGMRQTHTLDECPLRNSVMLASYILQPASPTLSPISPTLSPTLPTTSTTIPSTSTQTKNVTCPICRGVSVMLVSPRKILGLTDICCVCKDNSVEILLTKCFHVCLCKDCFDSINA